MAPTNCSTSCPPAGHFVYESGHHGDLWFDLDMLFVHPRRLQPSVAELAS